MSTRAQLEAYEAAKLGPGLDEVYQWIDCAGAEGLTADEAMALTGHYLPSVRREIRDLRERGLVMDSGESRPGNTGWPQAVWVLGDDRHVVLAMQLESVRNQADRLGYELVKKAS